MGTCICKCGEIFPEDKLIVKEYDSGYSEGECPGCNSPDNWEEAKACIVCGEWHAKDSYVAGCKICNDCAVSEYTPAQGEEFLKWLNIGGISGKALFYLNYLPFFNCGITNLDAIEIVEAGIKALGRDISFSLQEFSLVKYASEWVEFCEERIYHRNTVSPEETKIKHVA